MSDPCPEIAPRFGEQALGLLDPAEQAELEAHAASCAGCAEFAPTLETALAAACLPEAEPPAGAWERLEVLLQAERRRRTLRISLGCAFCHGSLARPQAVYCATCLTPHHPECFAEHGRCSTLGCDETHTVRAREGARPAAPAGRPGRRRRWRPWLGGVGVVLVAAAWAPMVLPDSVLPPGLRSDDFWRQGVSSSGGYSGHPLIVSNRGERMSFSADRARLSVLLSRVARVGQVTIVPPAQDMPITLSVENLPWREVLGRVARQARCQVEERADGVFALVRPRTVDLSYQDEDVREVLLELAEQGERRIILHPAVRGDVTTELRDTHWLQALHAIARTAGDFVVVEEAGGLLRVVPRESIAVQLETRFITLKQLRGAQAAALARQLQLALDQGPELPDGTHLALDAESHTLVLTSDRPTRERLLQIIDQRDRATAGAAAE